MKVLLIGNGAREHVIAETILKSKHDPELYAFMAAKNPGIAKLAKDFMISNLDNFNRLKEFVDKNKPDFAIIGPEAPLNEGIVDYLDELGVKSVGPLKALAKLETSKSFARELMPKYDIPGCPKFRVFRGTAGIQNFMDELDELVIKPDGLTGGKGVRVQGDHFQTKEEAYKYCEQVLKDHDSVIVEEKLEGEEFSLQSLSDGKNVMDFPPAQDHKRAFVDDKGPNTGGMGSYSCENLLLPFITKEHLEEAHKITEKYAEALHQETGHLYKGVMYGGFIVTKDGVKLLEYNARFGDPEAMNILPTLKTDFIDICLSVIDGTLDHITPEFENKATVCKYVVPEGYPTNPVKGQKVELGDIDDSVRVYFASVDEREDGLYMSSSRAIAFVGIADTMDEAEKMAESAIQNVKGPVFHRPDIGTAKLLQKRIDHMKSL